MCVDRVELSDDADQSIKIKRCITKCSSALLSISSIHHVLYRNSYVVYFVRFCIYFTGTNTTRMGPDETLPGPVRTASGRLGPDIAQKSKLKDASIVCRPGGVVG